MEIELRIAADPQEAFCPRCGRAVSCIQAYDAPTVVFGIVFYAWGKDTIVGCPRCVRLALVRRLFVNIVTANILCCLVVPIYVVQLSRSLCNTRPQIPDEYRSRLSTKPIRTAVSNRNALSPGVRLIIILVALVVVVTVVFVIIPYLSAK